MKALLIIVLILLPSWILPLLPARGEPPIHTWSISVPQAEPVQSEIHGTVFKLPRSKSRWQKMKSLSIKAGKLIMRFSINGVEVAGSIAQILQYARH